MFVWNEGNGLKLTNEPKFCTVPGPESETDECITLYKPRAQVAHDCGFQSVRKKLDFFSKIC